MKTLLSFLIFLLAFTQTNAQLIPVSDTVLKLKQDNLFPYALVAGGSKGIGYSIAEALAKRNYNLILIARHEDSLLAAKSRLEAAYPIHVEILVKDLAYENTATEIAAWCKERNIPLKMLCNVAGLGGEHDYLTLPLDSLRYMIRLNLEFTGYLLFDILYC
jgi:short-subunit dehydrogenase